MHELLTHESPKHFSDRLNAMSEDEYNAWGQNTTPTLRTRNEPEYGHELRHLIRRCLNLRPSLRPTVQEILLSTGPMVEYYEAEFAKTSHGVKNRSQQPTNSYKLPRLYFKENEINQMPLGPQLQNFGYDLNRQAAFALGEDTYVAPIWGPILHPNRTLFALRYRELAEEHRQKEQNANGKRTADEVSKPQQKRNRPQEPAKRPNDLYRRPKGVEELKKKRLVIPRNPFTPPAPAQHGTGFIAINVPRVGHDDRRPQRPGRTEIDSIDQALLASRYLTEDDKDSGKNLRNRRMHLWNNQRVTPRSVSMRQGRVLETVEEDISMGGV